MFSQKSFELVCEANLFFKCEFFMIIITLHSGSCTIVNAFFSVFDLEQLTKTLIQDFDLFLHLFALVFCNEQITFELLSAAMCYLKIF